jgi:hypothetical protein
LRPVGHQLWEAKCIKCDQCGHIDLRTSPTGRLNDFSKCRITEWFSKDDLQRANHRPLIAVGDPGDYMLVWPLERATQLAKAGHSVGFSLGPFGVIPRSQILRSPKPVFFSMAHPSEYRDYRRKTS